MLKGGSNGILPKEKVDEFVKKNATCVKFIEHIDMQYTEIAETKPDITVGFGFVSHNHGLSEGVPIDIYSMLLTAEKLRREILVKGAKVHILIGDHFAYDCTHDSCKDTKDITNKKNKYVKKINHILQNLGVREHYVFHFSSEIVESENYQKVKKILSEQIDKLSQFSIDKRDGKKAVFKDKYQISADTYYLVNTEKAQLYNESNRNYFLDQTAIFKYLYDYFGCGIKVSWSKSTKPGDVRKSVSFDEPHFDRFYRELFFDETKGCLSFVYSKSGFAVNRHDERARAIPYTAPIGTKQEVRRVLLSSKQPLPEPQELVNEDLIDSVACHAKILKELRPELIYVCPDNTKDKLAFYTNVSFLRQFGSAKETNLAILFKKLVITDKDTVEVSSTASNDTSQVKIDNSNT